MINYPFKIGDLVVDTYRDIHIATICQIEDEFTVVRYGGQI